MHQPILFGNLKEHCWTLHKVHKINESLGASVWTYNTLLGFYTSLKKYIALCFLSHRKSKTKYISCHFRTKLLHENKYTSWVYLKKHKINVCLHAKSLHSMWTFTCFYLSSSLSDVVLPLPKVSQELIFSGFLDEQKLNKSYWEFAFFSPAYNVEWAISVANSF